MTYGIRIKTFYYYISFFSNISFYIIIFCNRCVYFFYYRLIYLVKIFCFLNTFNCLFLSRFFFDIISMIILFLNLTYIFVFFLFNIINIFISFIFIIVIIYIILFFLIIIIYYSGSILYLVF